MLREATNAFGPKYKMGRGNKDEDPTITYAAAMPGVWARDKLTPVAIRRGLWAHVPETLADQLAQLRHPNILPLLGIAESPHSKRIDIIYPLMAVCNNASVQCNLVKGSVISSPCSELWDAAPAPAG